MTRDDFSDGIGTLISGNKATMKFAFTPKDNEVWFRNLEDLDGQTFIAAADVLVKTHNWFPSITLIRKTIAAMNQQSRSKVTPAHIDDQQKNVMPPAEAKVECRKVIDFLQEKMSMEGK